MPDQIYGVKWNGQDKVKYTYDGLGRLTNKKLLVGQGLAPAALNNIYTYENVNSTRTTTLVKSVQTAVGTYTYTYDVLGNISSINDGTYTTSYAYDSLGQLVRENDQREGVTYTYSYVNGNITEKKMYAYTVGELGEVQNTSHWTYGDSTWADLVTEFDGTVVTYDEIGNPMTVDSAQLTWCGRQLQSFVDGDATVSYVYNADGQRVSKDVCGVITEFFYNGSILAGQKTGDDVIVFMYDNNGDIFGLIYNGTEYYYIKNAQNDVVAIADSSGSVIAKYYYDAWGRVLDIVSLQTIAYINPIRYRSYYYDYETSFYYLNSRYYSVDLCRFLNADGIFDTGTGMLSYNMFAYCNNNPVNMIDSEGTGPLKEFFKKLVSKVREAVVIILTGNSDSATYINTAATLIGAETTGVSNYQARKNYAKDVMNIGQGTKGYTPSPYRDFRGSTYKSKQKAKDRNEISMEDYIAQCQTAYYQIKSFLVVEGYANFSWEELEKTGKADELVQYMYVWDATTYKLFNLSHECDQIINAV